MVHYSDFVVDSRIQRQARALAERGDRVDCVCLNDDVSFPVGTGEIALHRAAAGKPRGGARAYLSGNAKFLAGAARKVSALDREEPFDLVDDNMPDALVFAAWRPKLRGTPLILNFHDTFPELFEDFFDRSPRHPLAGGSRTEERISAALADGLVFVTPEARDLLASRGVSADRTEVVMNTPDERIFGERREPSAPLSEGEAGLSTTAASPSGSGSRCWCERWRCCAPAASRSTSTSSAPTRRRRGRLGGARRRGGARRGLRSPAADRLRRSPPASKKPTSASSPPSRTTSPSCCCRSSCSSTSTWVCRWSPRGCR